MISKTLYLQIHEEVDEDEEKDVEKSDKTQTLKSRTDEYLSLSNGLDHKYIAPYYFDAPGIVDTDPLVHNS